MINCRICGWIIEQHNDKEDDNRQLCLKCLLKTEKDKNQKLV